MSFPEVKDAIHKNVRIKNVGNQVYLYVKTDEQGKHNFSTKTVDLIMDPDVDFSLYFYTSAEEGETKMALLVHQETKVCFSMTSDKELKPSSLVHKLDGNELDGGLEDPFQFVKADNRFFYIWKSGEHYALEAMDGEHRHYFLSLDESSGVELRKVSGSNYPEETLFAIEDMDSIEKKN